MKMTFKGTVALLLAILCMSSLCLTAMADGEDGIGSAVAADGTTINGVGETAQESDSIINANDLKSRIDSYITEQGISGKNKVISIGYCYTATGDTWYYDGDQWCYSASLYKVPCCMLLAEKEYNGEITGETKITSQYANGTVDYMERKSIVESDNYTGHAVVEYLGGTYSGKCAEQTIKFTDLPEDYFPSDFKDYSYYSAKYYTQVLRTLYNDTDKYPRILDYMKQDQSYHYLDKDLNGAYQVAQKYGAFEEKNGNKNYHSAGIVYTPNPVIITILTKNITGFEKHIGALSKILVDYTLELDTQLTAFNTNKLIAQQQEAARLAQEEQQRLAQEAAAQQALTQAQAVPAQNPAPTPVTDTAFSAQQNQGTSIFLDPTPTPAAAASSGTPVWFSLPVVAGLGLVALIFIIVFIVKLRRARLDDEEFEEEEYEEYMRGDLSELAPREEKKKKSLKERFASGKRDDAQEDEYSDDYQDNYEDSYEEPYKEKYVDSYDPPKPAEKKRSIFGKKAKKNPDTDYEDYEEYADYDPKEYEKKGSEQRYDLYPDGNSDKDDYSDEYEDPDAYEEEPAPARRVAASSRSNERYPVKPRKANPVTYVEADEERNDGYDEYDDASYNAGYFQNVYEDAASEDASVYSSQRADTVSEEDIYSDHPYGLQTADESFDYDLYSDGVEQYAPEKERPAKKSGRFTSKNGYTPKH